MLRPIMEIEEKAPTIPSGALVKKWRERKGVTRQRLARLSGITPRHLMMIELGRRTLTRSKTIIFADILGIEYDDLLVHSKR